MNKFFLLIFMVSCSHSPGERGSSFKAGAGEARSIGLELDALSLSSFKKEELEKRREKLRGKTPSASLLAEELLVEFLSGEVSEELPRKLMEEVGKEGASGEALDFYYYRLLLSSLRKKDFARVFYFLPRLLVSESSTYKARAYNVDGILSLKAGDIEGALDSFEEAHRLDAEDESARLNLAFLNFEYGLFKEASKALQGSFKHPMGAFLQELLHQVEEGQAITMDSCRSYIKRFPKNKIFLYNCGQLAYYKYQEKALAKEWLSACLSSADRDKAMNERVRETLRLVSP